MARGDGHPPEGRCGASGGQALLQQRPDELVALLGHRRSPGPGSAPTPAGSAATRVRGSRPRSKRSSASPRCSRIPSTTWCARVSAVGASAATSARSGGHRRPRRALRGRPLGPRGRLRRPRREEAHGALRLHHLNVAGPSWRPASFPVVDRSGGRCRPTGRPTPLAGAERSAPGPARARPSTIALSSLASPRDPRRCGPNRRRTQRTSRQESGRRQREPARAARRWGLRKRAHRGTRDRRVDGGRPRAQGRRPRASQVRIGPGATGTRPVRRYAALTKLGSRLSHMSRTRRGRKGRPHTSTSASPSIVTGSPTCPLVGPARSASRAGGSAYRRWST